MRVFLLDDHEVVRRGLREMIDAEADLEVVGEAEDAERALGRIPAARPDVAVLDVRLPDGNGVEVCREIRSRHPEIQCLMLTSYADDEALFSAIIAGASGYLLKQVKGSDLVDGIRRVGRGESLLDPRVTARVLERLRAKPADDELGPLTDQERRIFDLIGEGLTNRQIGEELSIPLPADFELKGDHPTVRKMVRRGRDALEGALGEEGWRTHAQAMRVRMDRWLSSGELERAAELESEALDLPYEEALQRVEEENERRGTEPGIA